MIELQSASAGLETTGYRSPTASMRRANSLVVSQFPPGTGTRLAAHQRLSHETQ